MKKREFVGYKFLERNEGITLATLVVTIVLLLILAAIAIGAITGQNGLFARANYSADIYGKKSAEEAERVNGLADSPYLSGVNNSSSSSTNPNDTNNPQGQDDPINPVDPNIPDDTKLTGIVTFIPSTSEWINTNRDGAVKITMTTDSGYDVQYSMTGNENDWHSYPTGGIDVTINNQTVYARLIETSTGKTSDNYSTTISNIDNVAPSAFTFDVTATENTITVTGNTSAHATETGQSPISYLYKLDNGDWQVSNTFTGLESGSTHTVYMKAVDGAGNETNGTNNGNTGMSVTTWAEVPDLSIASGNVTFTQNTNNWTSTDVDGPIKVYITTTASGFDLQYSLTGEENDWQAYTINGVDVTTNNQNVYARVIDTANNRAGGQAVATVTNIDNDAPVVNSALLRSDATTKSITTTINVADADSGLGHITWYYKKSTDVEWQNLTNTYQSAGATAGAIISQTKTHTFENLDQTSEYYFYAEVYDVAGNKVNSGTSTNPVTISTGTVTGLTVDSNITFGYSTIDWTNQDVVITLTIDNAVLGDNTLMYKIGNNGTWTEYDSTEKIRVTENNTVYVSLYDGRNYGESATGSVTKIDKTNPAINTGLAESDATTNSITTTITVTDADSGLGHITWYYKKSTDIEWQSVTDTYQSEGATAGAVTAQTKTHTFENLDQTSEYYFYAEVYDVAGNKVTSGTSTNPVTISTGTVTGLTADSNITFGYSSTNWTNENVIVTLTIDNAVLGDNTLMYKIGNNGTWTEYDSTEKITVAENNTVYVSLYDGKNYGESATGSVTKIDKTNPVVNTGLAVSTTTTNSITTTINVTDVNSGLGHITWYYKKSTDVEWQNITDTYQAEGATAGAITAQTKTHTFENLDQTSEYNFYAEVYDVAGNMVTGGTSSNPITGSTGTVTGLTADSNITFNYSTTNWTNQDVVITLTIDNEVLGDNTLRYKIGNNGTWTEYNSTTGINMSDNNTVYVALYDGKNYGESATGSVTKIDKVKPSCVAQLSNKTRAGGSITTNIMVRDFLSGFGKIIYYYRELGASEWETVIDISQEAGSIAGETTSLTKNYTFRGLDTFKTYQIYAEIYDVAGNMSLSKSANNPLEIGPAITKYAVQIYGINQDESTNGNKIGLTFGPATGADYNNAYVTHTYEETSEGSGVYNVIIVTHTVASDGNETTSTEYLINSEGDNVTRTTFEKNKYDVNMHNMTWKQIYNVSDKTVFTDCMLCGDTKCVTIYLNDTIGTGKIINQYGDGAGGLYDSIKNGYCNWNPSMSVNSSAVNGGTVGSNARNAGGYASSHIRATLIGENAKTDITYAGNENLTSETCLLSCFESGLPNLITAKKINYVTGTNYTEGNYNLNNDISDKIWLLSSREVLGTGTRSGGITEGIGASGVGYEKFTNTESKYYISQFDDSSLTQRAIYIDWNRGQSYTCWLRSIVLYGNAGVSYISDGSTSGSFNAYGYYGLAFGFCIDGLPKALDTEANATNITVSVKPNYVGPDGTTYQYQINGGEWVSPEISTDTTYTFTGLNPETTYTVNVKIGNAIQNPQNVDTKQQKSMKDVATVADAIKYSASAIPNNDPDYDYYKELSDDNGDTVKVPVGFTVRYDSAENVEDGVVIADANDNQWVWIPVNENNPYERRNFIDDDSVYKYGEFLDDITGAEVKVATVGGFYIARYEAGSAEDTSARTMRTGETTARTVTLKKNQIPYNYVCLDYGTSDIINLCNELAIENNYKTGIMTKLCSSYAWDTALNFIGNESWSKGTGTGYQSIKQNYVDSVGFKYKKISNGVIVEADKPISGNYQDAELVLTGQGDATKNIYDMGGNCYEYTTEYSFDTDNPVVSRGGVYSERYRNKYNGTVDSSAGYRYYYHYGNAEEEETFRPTMYLPVPADLTSSNTTFTYTPSTWTNQNVTVGLTLANGVQGNNRLRYKIGLNGTWTDYNNTNKITATENCVIYTALYDGSIYGDSATGEVTKIDKVAPVVNSNIAKSANTSDSITTTITVTDANSGLGRIVWHYKKATDSSWTDVTDTYQSAGATAGLKTTQTELHTFNTLDANTTYQFYADVYDVAGNMTSSGSASNPVEVVIELATYTITYHANTGSGTMADTTGPTVTVATNGFTAPTGKAFRCWNTSADGTGTRYDVGVAQSQNLTQNLDLYAQWYQNVYEVGDTVTYNGERFYVIEDSNASDSTVRMLTEKIVDPTDMTHIVQADDSYDTPSNFSETAYWLDDEENVLPKYNTPAGVTVDTNIDANEGKTAMYIAQEYGKQIGAEIGTLLTSTETQSLSNPILDIPVPR